LIVLFRASEYTAISPGESKKSNCPSAETALSNGADVRGTFFLNVHSSSAEAEVANPTLTTKNTNNDIK
jgi:hypothetical protein